MQKKHWNLKTEHSRKLVKIKNTMNILKTVSLFILSSIVLSCGTARNTSSAVDAAISSKELIELHHKSEARFSTLASRVHVNYDDGKATQSMTVSLRIKKDETIWVSASVLGISIARLLITPEKVSYYETIGKTYFDGDFSLLSSWLGIDIDFEMAQNILLGNAVFELDDKKYTTSVSGGNFRLTPKKQLDLFQHIFLVNSENYKIASQQLIQQEEQRALSIDYLSYQESGKHVYPKEIRLNSVEQNAQTRIELDFRKIDVNPAVTFPFNLPEGYEELKLNE